MGEPQLGDDFPSSCIRRGARNSCLHGNPHYVVFTEEYPPGWQAEAAEIGRHHDFKYGINVELVIIKDRIISKPDSSNVGSEKRNLRARVRALPL